MKMSLVKLVLLPAAVEVAELGLLTVPGFRLLSRHQAHKRVGKQDGETAAPAAESETEAPAAESETLEEETVEDETVEDETVEPAVDPALDPVVAPAVEPQPMRNNGDGLTDEDRDAAAQAVKFANQITATVLRAALDTVTGLETEVGQITDESSAAQDNMAAATKKTLQDRSTDLQKTVSAAIEAEKNLIQGLNDEMESLEAFESTVAKAAEDAVKRGDGRVTELRDTSDKAFGASKEQIRELRTELKSQLGAAEGREEEPFDDGTDDTADPTWPSATDDVDADPDAEPATAATDEETEDQTEDQTEGETEAPAAESETEAPAAESETEAPAAESETLAPAAENETE